MAKRSKNEKMTEDDRIKDLRKKIEESGTYLNEEYINTKWNYYDQLYQSIRILPDSENQIDSWRSNIFIPLIYQTIADTLPRLVQGLIGKGDFFTVYPRSFKDKKEYDSLMKSAKIFEELMKIEFDIGNFKKAINDACIRGLVKGLGWIKLEWRYEKEDKEYFDVRKGKIVKIKKNEIIYDNPYWTSPDTNCIFFDKNAKNYDDIQYIVEEEKVTYEDLLYKAEQKAYIGKNIKKFIEEKNIAEKGYNCADRYVTHTVYTNNRIDTLLEGNYLIRSHISPYKNKKGIPFFPITYWPEPDRLVSRGICELLSDLQEHLNDIFNLKADNLVLSINNIIITKEDTDLNVPLEIYPGAKISLENPDDFRVEKMGGVDNSAFTEINSILGLANRTVGSAPSLITPEDGTPVNNKTATAANILQESMATRFSTIIDNNITNCIGPMVKFLIDLNQQYMSTERAKEMIGQRAMENLQVEKDNIDFNVDYDYIISGKEGHRTASEELKNILTALQIISNIPGADQIMNLPMIIDKIAKDLDLPKGLIKDIDELQQNKFDINKLDDNGKKQLNQLAQDLGMPVDKVIVLLSSGATVEQLAKVVDAKQKIKDNPNLVNNNNNNQVV